AGQSVGVLSQYQNRNTTSQRRERSEGKARRQVQLHFRPGVTELVDGGHQPLEAAVTLDGHVQAAGCAAGQARQVAFGAAQQRQGGIGQLDRKSTRLNSSHVKISYAVFCLKKK